MGGGAEWRVRRWWLRAEGSRGTEGKQLMGLGGQGENLASTLWETGSYCKVLGRMGT